MLIRCPECKTGYNLNPRQIGPQGRVVRCIRCANEWFQNPIEEPTETAPPLPPEPTQEQGNHSAINDTKKSLKKRVVVSVLATAIILGGIIGLLITLKGEIIEKAPVMAGIYQAMGIDIKNSSKESMSSDTGLIIPADQIERTLISGQPITLSYSGVVTNTNSVEVMIPRIVVSLYNNKGVEIDQWPAQLEKTTLQPEESTVWTVRFFSPPLNLDDIAEHKVYFSK